MYKSCKRFDLLNKFYQARNEWSKVSDDLILAFWGVVDGDILQCCGRGTLCWGTLCCGRELCVVDGELCVVDGELCVVDGNFVLWTGDFVLWTGIHCSVENVFIVEHSCFFFS